MKTTLDIDEGLIEKAKEILGTRTLKETVDRSLRAVVRQKALESLANAAGTVAQDPTVEKLRQQPKKRTSIATRISR